MLGQVWLMRISTRDEADAVDIIEASDVPFGAVLETAFESSLETV